MAEPGITLIAYSNEDFMSRKLGSLEELERYLDYPVVWVNVTGLEEIESIGEYFKLNETIVRAMRRKAPEVRAMFFDDHLFLLLHQVYEVEGGLKREKIGLILRGNVLVTIQEVKGDVFNRVRERIREGEGLIRKRGADYLLFALLEAIVENYVPILERISAEMEKTESLILRKPDQVILKKIHHMRREVLFMRRTVFPLLEFFRRLRMEGASFFGDETAKQFEELHDHVRDILGIIETQKELADSLVEFYYSTISMRTNEVMRILTVVSTIFIPLTFITGLYGMNFRHMPELQWRYGYPVVLLLMLGIALGMLVYFRRKGWI
ncbi:magnesium and cobalt transport protein CorA [Thermococcus profundus]|uniref:Magnesium transport protein CorA n=1 Tax=Thermococcus profundus TaxID=49899 RepID=A0A2Z2MKH7_THEPR|nr:magnesium/cobalt transporter CorA [Thermococcus profundus]ASJ02931.1 magnesium and cobalt transport protein CorA [Thermococcus profundus]